MELYHFYFGDQHWRYTSGVANVTVSGIAYTAQSISRSEIQWDVEKQEASIEMPDTLYPAPLFVAFNPSTVLWVDIMNANGIKIFMGKVVSCTLDVDNSKAILKVISIQAVFKGMVPSRTYGAGCPWELFDTDCGLSGPTWAIVVNTNSVVRAADYRTLTCADFALKPDGYFNGGYITLSYETAYIISHIGNTIILLFPLLLWASGMSMGVYPGCDKTLATCRATYSNEANYGGCPFIPNQNVMTQGF